MKALALTIVLITTLLGGCKERVPPSNTEAYLRLHGIVNDGKTENEITLINDRNNNRPKLRFPPPIAVTVETLGAHSSDATEIRKGIAHFASVALELNREKQLIPIVTTPNHLVFDTVKIRWIASLGPDDAQKTEARLQEIERQSARTSDKKEWGLKEYTPTIGGRLQSYAYVPLDEGFRSIDGARMWIGCNVGGANITNNEGPSSCSGSFNHPRGVAVTYTFDSRLLPYWREIYQEVYKFTDSVVVSVN